jgi:hypothetical protein
LCLRHLPVRRFFPNSHLKVFFAMGQHLLRLRHLPVRLFTPHLQRLLLFRATHFDTAAHCALQRLAMTLAPATLVLQALAGRLGDAELALLALAFTAAHSLATGGTTLFRHGFLPFVQFCENLSRGWTPPMGPKS